MANLKIVLNWASICTSSVPMEAGCDTCPYREKHDGFRTCIESLLFDALTLLKKQELRIKNRDESLEKAQAEIKWLRGMLKEQEPKPIVNKWHKNPLGDYSRLHCPWCDRELDMQSAKEYVACPYCGRSVSEVNGQGEDKTLYKR